MYEKEIELKIRRLSKELQKDVLDYVNSLLKEYNTKPHKRLKYNWTGALADISPKMTSVELQHKASEWRHEIFN